MVSCEWAVSGHVAVRRRQRRRVKTTYRDISEKEDPLESIPAHTGLRPPARLAAKPTAVDAIIVIVSLPRHARFAAPERLAAPTPLGQQVALAFASAADPGCDERGGELGGEVVDAEGDGAVGVVAQQRGAWRKGYL
jgi:hypothetical protein